MCDIQTFWKEIALVFPPSYPLTCLRPMKKLLEYILDFEMGKKILWLPYFSENILIFVVFNKIPDEEWLSKA